MKRMASLSLIFFTFAHTSSVLAGSVSNLMKEYLAKNIQVEALGLQYHLTELGTEESHASKPWTFSMSGNYVDSQLESASASAYDTKSQGATAGLSKSFFSGTTLSLNTGLTKYQLTPKSGGSSTDYSEGYQQLSLAQDLGKNFFGFSDRLGLKIADLSKEKGAVVLNKGMQAQVLSFYSALLKTSLYRSMVEFSKEAYQRGVQHTELVKRRVRDGLREKVDLYQVEMTQRSLEENVLSTQKNYEDAQTELSAMLQRKVEDHEILDLMKETIAHRPISAVSWDQSMDAEVLRKELSSLKLSLSQARNAMIPSLKLSASLKNNAQDEAQSKAFSDSTLGGEDKEMTVGVSFAWNIGSELESINKQRAKAQLIYKEAEEKSAKKAYEFEIDKMLKQLGLIDKQIDSSEEKMKLAKQVLGEYTKLYNQGRADLDRLIDAESSLINTQNGHVSYLFNREILAANLLYVDNKLMEYLESK